MRRKVILPAIAGLLVACSWFGYWIWKKAPGRLADGYGDLGVAETILKHSGGQQVRLVWTQAAEDTPSDIFGRSSTQVLMGYDTATGKTRRISPQVGNFSRPLLTPDGKSVVYSERSSSKEKRTSSIHILDWESGVDRVLLSGFAVDVVPGAHDEPAWIYALHHLNPENELALDGESLFRFPINQPEASENVWDRSTMAVDNLQISRDGQIFAGLFPWPDAGMIHLPSKTYHQLEPGCWPSLAPDNSYVSWVFDGTHKKLHMHDRSQREKWTLSVHKGEGLDGEQAYHPRWSPMGAKRQRKDRRGKQV